MPTSRVIPAETERQRALLATAELWNERGYGGLSVEAICDRAGIEAERFEAMFGSVEAAASAAFEVPLTAVVGIVGDLYSPDRSEAESYAVAIVGILELMAANPAYAFLAYLAGRQEAPSRVHEIYKSGLRLLVAMLERLWAHSALPEQPMRAGQGALGAAEAVVRREILAGRHKRLPALAPDFIYGAITPFLGQAEGLRLAELGRQHVGQSHAG